MKEENIYLSAKAKKQILGLRALHPEDKAEFKNRLLNHMCMISEKEIIGEMSQEESISLRITLANYNNLIASLLEDKNE